MKKVLRLTESDLTKIVKKVLNENITRSTDEFYSLSRKVLAYLDELNKEMKKGDPKKIEESKDLVKHYVRNLEQVIDEIKQKLR